MEHGTVEMYRKELRTEGLEPCAPCRAAQALVISEYRNSHPVRDRSAETRNATIKRRALVRLAAENPGRLAVLVAQERAIADTPEAL